MFSIPKRNLEQSSVFEDMFTLPRCDESDLEGSSDKKPIVLEDISSDAFASFLTVLCPLYVQSVMLICGIILTRQNLL